MAYLSGELLTAIIVAVATCTKNCHDSSIINTQHTTKIPNELFGHIVHVEGSCSVRECISLPYIGIKMKFKTTSSS